MQILQDACPSPTVKRKRNGLGVNTATKPPCPCHPQHRKVAGLFSLDGSSPCPHDLATWAMRRAKCSCSFSLLALLPLPGPPPFAVSTRDPFYSPHFNVGFIKSSSSISSPRLLLFFIIFPPLKRRNEKKSGPMPCGPVYQMDLITFIGSWTPPRTGPISRTRRHLPCGKSPQAQRRIKLENNPPRCRSWCAPRRDVGIGALNPWACIHHPEVRRMSIRHGQRDKQLPGLVRIQQS